MTKVYSCLSSIPLNQNKDWFICEYIYSINEPPFKVLIKKKNCTIFTSNLEEEIINFYQKRKNKNYYIFSNNEKNQLCEAEDIIDLGIFNSFYK